jgi:mRNA interferase MazF
MSFSRSEVVLLQIPFTDLTSRKVRPAVIVGHGSHPGDLFVVPISSQLQNVDLVHQDWRAAI